MIITGLNNTFDLQAENQSGQSSATLQTTSQQASSGSGVNSATGASESTSIATEADAIESTAIESLMINPALKNMLQVADGALSQITTLLNNAVTLATEASTGAMNSSQTAAANEEYQKILSEITSIGYTTTYNQESVFSMSPATDEIGAIAATSDNLGGTALTNAASATSALAELNKAVSDVAGAAGPAGTWIASYLHSSFYDASLENSESAADAAEAADYTNATAAQAGEAQSQIDIASLAQSNKVKKEEIDQSQSTTAQLQSSTSAAVSQ